MGLDVWRRRSYNGGMKIVEKIKRKQSELSRSPAVTIVCIGDSVTQGCFECFVAEDGNIDAVFDSESSFASRLKSMLNLLYPKVQFNMINAGVSGESAQGGLRRLERDVFAYAPDLVIVGYALNDACQGREGLASYKKAMGEILASIRDHGAECIVLTPNAMNTRTSCFLKEKPLIRLAEKFAKLQNEGVLDAYAETAREVARERGAVLCDVYAEWKKMIEAGVDVTALLANHLNHPIRDLHDLTAMMLCSRILG